MIIEFTKDHPVGIPKGSIKKVDNKLGERIISEGFAKESNEEAFEKIMSAAKEAEKKRIAELKENYTLEEKAKQDQEAAVIKTKDEDCGCGDKVKKEGEEECEDCKKKAAAKKTIGAGTRKKRTTKKTK